MDTTCGYIKIYVLVVVVVALILTINKSQYQNKNNEVIYKNEAISEEPINCDMIITNYCITRQNPDETSNKIYNNYKGDRIEVISKLATGWYKVKTNDKIGYIQEKYLESTKEIFIDENKQEIKSVKPDGTIHTDGEVTTSNINYAYNYWYMIPIEIRDKFRVDGWKIILTSNDIQNKVNVNYEIVGVTLPETKEIWIVATQKSIRNALIHEIGHYIDYSLGYKSKQQKFKELYNATIPKLQRYEDYKIANYSYQEYYAEMFKGYITNDKVLYTIANDTLKEIEKSILELGDIDEN